MSKFIMKIMCYFKKHFVTRIRSFVFTYRKSIERKCPMTNTIIIILDGVTTATATLVACYWQFASLMKKGFNWKHSLINLKHIFVKI